MQGAGGRAMRRTRWPRGAPDADAAADKSQGGFAGGYPGGLSGSGGGEAQELPLHRIDIGKICRDELVAATLAGQQMKAAARESAGGPRAAEMDDGGKILLLLRARLSVALAGENRRDIAVEEHRRELDGIARRAMPDFG